MNGPCRRSDNIEALSKHHEFICALTLRHLPIVGAFRFFHIV